MMATSGKRSSLTKNKNSSAADEVSENTKMADKLSEQYLLAYRSSHSLECPFEKQCNGLCPSLMTAPGREKNICLPMVLAPIQKQYRDLARKRSNQHSRGVAVCSALTEFQTELKVRR